MISCGALADALDQLAAVGAHRVVEFGELARDKVAQRAVSRVMRSPSSVPFALEQILENAEAVANAFGKFGAVVGEALFEDGEALRNAIAKLDAAAGEALFERRQALRNAVAKLAAALCEHLLERLQALRDQVAHDVAVLGDRQR